jgi:Flp pilus assembly protein TadD
MRGRRRRWIRDRQTAKALFAAGLMAESLEHFRAASALAPEDPTHAYNLGAALEESGDAASALAAYETVLRLAPGFGPALAGLERLGAAGR